MEQEYTQLSVCSGQRTVRDSLILGSRIGIVTPSHAPLLPLWRTASYRRRRGNNLSAS